MPVLNPRARELVFKIVYYGPGLGGKTTTLQHIHSATRPEHRGKLVSLATPVDRTLYFDFLPLRLPAVRGLGVRLQLFTVPGQVHYDATRKLVLTGADGVVMVYDSQPARLDANLESLENLRDNLVEHGRSLAELPHVVQHNKRDLEDALPLEQLDAQLNPHRAPSFAVTATSGEGVFEALEAIARAVLDDFERRVPEPRAAPVRRLAVPEAGLTEVLRRTEADPPASSALPRVNFKALFSAEERALAEAIEGALAAGQFRRAVDLSDELASGMSSDSSSEIVPTEQQALASYAQAVELCLARGRVR